MKCDAELLIESLNTIFGITKIMESATPPSVLVERVDLPSVSAFWKENEPLLHQLEKAKLPAKSRLICKEISNKENTVDGEGNPLIIYDMINIYDNRKNFLSIRAQFSSDHSSIIKEEIIAGDKLSEAKKTVVDGRRVKNKAQIDWLKEMSQNEVHQLFRT